MGPEQLPGPMPHSSLQRKTQGELTVHDCVLGSTYAKEVVPLLRIHDNAAQLSERSHICSINSPVPLCIVGGEGGSPHHACWHDMETGPRSSTMRLAEEENNTRGVPAALPARPSCMDFGMGRAG